MVLEKTVESPSDCKEIQPVHSKGDQSWVFIGGTDVEAETPILWPPDAESWLIGKDPDAGKDWGQEEKGMTEDEMVGWHHQLCGHVFEQGPGDGEGQGSLACCSPWGHQESDTTERLNNKPLRVNTVLGILARTIRREKELKGNHVRMEKIKLSLFTCDTILWVENPKDFTHKKETC